MKMKTLLLPMMMLAWSLSAVSAPANSNAESKVIASNVVEPTSNDSTASISVVNTDDSDNEESSESSVAAAFSSDLPSPPETWWIGATAIIGAISVFLAPVLAIFVVCYFINKSKNERNRVIMAAIESGREIPLEMLNPKADKNTPRQLLMNGVSYVAWGVGLMLFFRACDLEAVSLLMAVPVIIGLGKLTVYYIDKRKASKMAGCDDEAAE